MIKGKTSSPWQWERGRWRSWSVGTRAAGWPGVILAPSPGCKCRRGWWWRRAARSKRGTGKRCRTETTARGLAPASQCSRRCRKVLDCNGPTAPKAPRQTQMHNPTLPPPGAGPETTWTCYLIRRNIQFHTQISFTPPWSRQVVQVLVPFQWGILSASPWFGKQTLRQHTKESAVRLVRLHRPNSTPHMA